MAGDLNITERAVLEGAALPSAAAPARGTTIHRYGRVSIVAAPGPADDRAVPGAAGFAEPLDGLSEVEHLGVAALRLRESEGYRAAKRNRPRADEDWDMPGCTTLVPSPHQPGAGSAWRLDSLPILAAAGRQPPGARPH